MRPQIIVHSLAGVLLLSASFLNADGVEDNNIQQSNVVQSASEEPVAESVNTDKNAKKASEEQAVFNDMQNEFNKSREDTWDDRYRY